MIFFTDYRDIKFKLSTHRLDSDNRNTILWNENYHNTPPKITQYRKLLRPPQQCPLLTDFYLKVVRPIP